jgi:general secretion pathway protein L
MLTTSLQNGITTAAGNFWRWWRGELVQLLPMTVRARLQHRQLLPVVAYSETQWELWVPSLENDRVTRVKQAVFEMSGEPETRALQAREAMTHLASPVALSLPASLVLRRTLVLPAALEENLKQALAYDLDRHTPFRGDELYFDARVIGRNSARGEIQVALATVQRAHADRIMAQLRDAGAEIVALLANPPENIESKLNLLPTESRPSWEPWQRWAAIIGAVLIVLLLAAVITLPIWQKRTNAIKLRQQADIAHIQAMEVERLRSELDRLVADYDFVPEHKGTYPSTVHLLNEITKVLPDDTWLTQMELKNTVSGKETRHEVFLRGESEHASRLVTLLEESGLVAQAAPRSPITAIPGGGEMFDIGAKIKQLQPPERVAVVIKSKEVLPPILPITPVPPAPPSPPPEPPPAPPVAVEQQPVVAPPPAPPPAVVAPRSAPSARVRVRTPAPPVSVPPAPPAAPVEETVDRHEGVEDDPVDNTPHEETEGGG